MAQVTLPDGNVVTVPDFALDSTAQDMKKLLAALVGADEKALKIYENIIANAREQKKVTEEAARDAKDLQEKQNKLTEKIADAAEKGKIFSGDNLMKGVNKLDGFLTKSFMSIGSLALTGAGALFQSVMSVGDTLLELQKYGVGFTDATGSAEKLIADLNYLGLSSKEAADLMKGAAGSIQVLGKTGFSEIQKTFAELSDNGNALGLSLAESAGILAEDLELRKTLGMLDTIDKQAQAKRSRDLYAQQLKAAQALGKSVEEIRDGNQALIEDNINFQISRARTAARLGEEAGAAYLASVEQLGTQFQGMGLDKSAQDAILTAMSEPTAFLAQGGTELYTALSSMGAGGRQIAGEMQTIGKLMNGNAAEQEEGMKRMKQFAPMLQKNLSGLLKDEKSLAMFQNLINAGSPASGMLKSLFESAGLADSALKGMENSANSFQSGLAKGSQAYGAAMDTITGSLSGAMTDLTAAFAGPAGAFADALTKDTILRNKEGEILDKNGKAMTRTVDKLDENGKVIGKQTLAIKDYNDLSEEQKKQMTGTASVMSVFKQAVQTIRETIMKSFGMVGDDAGDLAQKIREWLIPRIEDFAAWFKDGGWESIKDAFVNLKEGVIAVTAPFRAFYNLLTAPWGEKFNTASESLMGVFDTLGGKIGLAIGSFLLITKTLKLYNGALGLGKKGLDGFKSLFGGGGGPGSAGGVVSQATGGVTGQAGNAAGDMFEGKKGSFGKSIADIGKNIGKAIKGLAKGVSGAVSTLADGLKNAVTSLATGLKNVFVALAEGIGQGVAALGKGIGTALGAILKGLAGGLAAFANPTILLGAAILGGAITLIGAGIAGAAWIMGKALPTFAEGLQSFADIDGDNLLNVAKGIGAIGVAMAAMGAGGAAGSIGTAVSGIVDGIAGFFGADDPLDKINEFAAYEFDVAKVLENASAVKAFGEAMATLGAGGATGAAGGLFNALADLAGASPLDMLKQFSDTPINIAGIDHNILAMDRLHVLFAKYAGLSDALPQNADEINATAESINKTTMMTSKESDVKIEKPVNAYDRIVRRQKRKEKLMQPGVMAVDKQGNAIDTGAPTEALKEAQQLARDSMPKDTNPAKSSGSTGTSTNRELLERIEAHLAAISGNTGKSTKQLGRLDRTIQQDW